MSGNWVTNIENIDVCPTCKNPTVLYDAHVTYANNKPILVLHYSHQKTEQKSLDKLENECEAFSESGGYWVYIPIKEDVKQISQEWY